jgi:hypothetical protein
MDDFGGIVGGLIGLCIGLPILMLLANSQESVSKRKQYTQWQIFTKDWRVQNVLTS